MLFQIMSLNCTTGGLGSIAGGIVAFLQSSTSRITHTSPSVEIAVATAVSAEQRRADAHDLIAGRDHARHLKAGFDQVAVQIDVRRDVMRDRPGVAAQADAAVERGRAEPDRPAFLAILQHHPQANMMPLVGTLSDRLLECQVLGTSGIEQRLTGARG